MPVYEFYCSSCGGTEDVIIPIAKYDEERDKQKCSQCGAIMKRRIGPVAMNLESLRLGRLETR